MVRSVQRQADSQTLTRKSNTSKFRLEVVREVCDADGQRLGVVHARYDGSVDDAVRVAKSITEMMYARFPDASNIQSRIGVTDENGRGRWIISPNFSHVAEAGTSEGVYIFGDLNFASAT